MTADPVQCAKCGQVHAECRAHRRDGSPCRTRPMRGQGVCRMHGGMTPAAIEKAERKMSAEGVEIAVRAFGLPVVTTPTEALLGELYRAAGSVAWLDTIVAGLDHDAITWGVSQEVEKNATEFEGVDITKVASVNVWVQLWQSERDRLARVAKICHDVKIDDQRVDLARRHGALLGGLIERVLAAVLAGLLERHLLPETELEPVWRVVTAEVVPGALLAAATETP